MPQVEDLRMIVCCHRLKAEDMRMIFCCHRLKVEDVRMIVSVAAGHILPVAEKTYRRLLMLMNVMTTSIPHVAGLNPKGILQLCVTGTSLLKSLFEHELHLKNFIFLCFGHICTFLDGLILIMKFLLNINV